MFIGNDASIIGNATISGTLTVNGNLTAVKTATKYIVNTTTSNYQLIVTEDLSLNGRLFTSGDVSLNGNLTLNSSLPNYTTVSPNNKVAQTATYSTISNSTSTWFNNGIAWYSIVSSGVYINDNDTRYPQNAFDGATTSNSWLQGNNASGDYNTKYNTSTPFGYNGSIKTTLPGGIGDVLGEWIQINSSVPVIIKDYTLYSADQYERAPKTYYIAGSNDGITWYPIIYVIMTSVFTTAYATMGKITIPSGSATNVSGTTTATLNYTYTTYGNGSTAYTTFMLITTNVYGGLGGVGLGEWNINFTPPTTNNTTLSMNTTNYNQLNVSSGATFTGSVSIVTLNSVSMTSSSFLGFGYGGGLTGTPNRWKIEDIALNRDNGKGPNYDYGAQSKLIFSAKSTNLYNSEVNDQTYVEGMTLVPNGPGNGGLSTGINVGIGTTNPRSLLVINCNTNTRASQPADAGEHHGLQFRGAKVPDTGKSSYGMVMGSDYESGNGYIHCAGNNAVQSLMLQQHGGYVGIGMTTNPTCPLHIGYTSGVAGTGATANYYLSSSGSNNYLQTTTSTGFDDTSLFCLKGIISASYIASVSGITFSDKRIKTNINNMDNSIIQKFREIQPKVYQYIDKIQYGNHEHYGVIAQEIEELLPCAIKYQKLHVPNIYDMGDISNNIITLKTKSTSDFEYDASGILFPKLQCYDASNTEITVNITKIIDDKSFEIDVQQEITEIFVYGQEVNNYRAINYDTLFMLSFYVTQILDKEHQNSKQEILDLQAENQELKSQIQTILERLSAANIP